MLLLRREPLGMFAVSSFGFRLASSSVGVLLLLRSPWLTESSAASGRFARKIDTVAFPSATNKFLCSNGLDEAKTYRSLRLGTFPPLLSPRIVHPIAAIARVGIFDGEWAALPL
jgi:hypothetical protein